MSWVILVLIAVLFWSIMAIIQKFTRVTYFENSLGYLIFIVPTTIFAITLLLFQPFVFLEGKLAFLALSTGIVLFIGYYFYLESLHKEEVSKVVILFGIAPIFVLILSRIFLKEILTLNQYIAFILILIGSILVSFKKIEQKIKITAGLIFIVLSNLLFAIQSVLLKYVSSINLTTMMIYREFGYLISACFLFLISPKVRTYTKKVVNDLNIKKTALVYSAEIIGMCGMFLSYLAIQKGPISLISVTESFQSVFTLILVIIISVFIPKILKEEIGKKTITIKIISIILMIVGLYLISV